MADRIAVMNAGVLEQFDAPETLYDRPATLFVAGFVGTANLIPGRLAGAPGSFVFADESGASRIELPRAGPCSRAGPVIFAARPEHLELIDSVVRDNERSGGIPARVEMVLPLGPSLVYELARQDGSGMKVVVPRGHDAPRLQVGDAVTARVRPGAPVSFFSA